VGAGAQSRRGDDLYVGVDIGGTFTDCAVIDAGGQIETGKTLTTPADFSIGFFTSIADAGQRMGLSLAELLSRTKRLAHGTTVGTNALVTRNGARVGLLATKGHTDALRIMDNTGRVTGAGVEETLDYAKSTLPEQLVRREDVRGIVERVDFEGRVVVELDRAQAEQAIRELVDSGVEAIAICLLWSFANPAHELEVARIAADVAPGLFVCTSHEVAPQIGDYQRAAATVFNAYIGPLMETYVTRLAATAEARGYRHPIVFGTVSGGLAGLDVVRRLPIRTLQSGPVAGAVATRILGQRMGEPNALATDMGGTTLDVGVIADGLESRTGTAVFERHQLHLRMVDIQSIGAGGGSIAWVDELTGVLRVGPRSAGSEPGPACFGRGGVEPTVTDADLVLGVLNPRGLLGGRLPLDRDRAEAAIKRVADKIGLDVQECAAGIVEIVDASMEDLVRRITGQQGLDPREFALMGYGGGGAVHASLYGRDLGVRSLIVPLGNVASVWSAVGVAAGELGQTFERPVFLRAPFDPAQVAAVVEQLEQEARAALERDGVARAEVLIRRTAELRYGLQVFEVETPVPAGELRSTEAMERIAASFDAVYEQSFGAGTGYREAGTILTVLRVQAYVPGPAVNLTRRLPDPYEEAIGPAEYRGVYWYELGGETPTPIYEGDTLQAGMTMIGPAIVEFPFTSAVVRPGQTAAMDAHGNLILQLGAVGALAPVSAGRSATTRQEIPS